MARKTIPIRILSACEPSSAAAAQRGIVQHILNHAAFHIDCNMIYTAAGFPLITILYISKREIETIHRQFVLSMQRIAHAVP